MYTDSGPSPLIFKVSIQLYAIRAQSTKKSRAVLTVVWVERNILYLSHPSRNI